MAAAENNSTFNYRSFLPANIELTGGKRCLACITSDTETCHAPTDKNASGCFTCMVAGKQCRFAKAAEIHGSFNSFDLDQLRQDTIKLALPDRREPRTSTDTVRPQRAATAGPSTSQGTQPQVTENHQPLRTDEARSDFLGAPDPSNVGVHRKPNGQFASTAKETPALAFKDRSSFSAIRDGLSGERDLRTRVHKPVVKSRPLTETTVNTSHTRPSERATGQQQITTSSEKSSLNQPQTARNNATEYIRRSKNDEGPASQPKAKPRPPNTACGYHNFMRTKCTCPLPIPRSRFDRD